MSRPKFPKEAGLALINDVALNFGRYWKDSSRSEPEKDKYVRSAKGKPLGELLERINLMVLTPLDKFVPDFIFGGITERDHVGATNTLLGNKRKRVLLGLDLQRFFEQIHEERVVALFQNKFMCSTKASKLIASFCCVPLGPKNQPLGVKSIARGFATSSRLALWANLDTFIRLNNLIQKRLRGKDPRIAIYVDDIGITASRVSEEQIRALIPEIKELLLHSDPNQPLPLNEGKTHVALYSTGITHLGIKLERNKLLLGKKSQANKARLKKQLEQKPTRSERAAIIRKYRGVRRYEEYVKAKTRS